MLDSISTVLSDFSSWLWDKLLYVIGYFVGFISNLIFKAYSLLNDVWNYIVDKYTDIKDYFYELISISDLFHKINILDGTGIGYFFDYFGGNQLIIASVSGYLVRFAIRRTPFIG